MINKLILIAVFTATFNLTALTQGIPSNDEVVSYTRACSVSCHTQLRYEQIQDLPCCGATQEDILVVTKSKPLGKGSYGTVYEAHSYPRKVECRHFLSVVTFAIICTTS